MIKNNSSAPLNCSKWKALVESRIGNNNLEKEQVESYLNLAKRKGADAVITISNQYVTNPAHHPINVSKTKTRTVKLFHFSWQALLAKAIIVSNSREVDDPEQSFIMDDLINFLDHPSSGVSALVSLHEDWPKVCQLVQQHMPLNKNSGQVDNVVATWQQLLRASAIKLSRVVRKPVEIALTNAQKKSPELLTTDMKACLTRSNTLDSSFVVPNAAATIRLIADLSRKNLSISMSIDAPEDVKRPTAAINWLTRQLKTVDGNGIEIRAYWPRRIPATSKPLELVIGNAEVLIPAGVKELPRSFEVV